MKVLFFLTGLLAGAGLFVFLLMRTGPENVVNSLMQFGLLPLLGFITISTLNFTLYSVRWKVILDQMIKKSERIPLSRMFLHRMSGFAVGYLTPAAQVAGEPIRVAMLRTDNIPLKEATSSVVLDLAFEITTFVLYVSLGILFAVLSGVDGDHGRTFLWSGIFIGAVLLVLISFFVATISGNGFFHRFLSMTRLNRFRVFADLEAWLKETEKLMSKFFVGKPWTIAFVLLLSVVMASFKLVEVIFISYFLGVHITVTEAFLMSTLPGVALLLPVPAGLGVFEGSNAAMFALLGLPLNAIAFTMVVRIRDFLFIGTGVFHAVQSGEKIFGGGAAK